VLPSAALTNGPMALDLRPLTLPELLDRSFSTYRRHVWLFAGIMAVPGVFAMVYAVLMQFVQYWIGPLTPAGGPVDPNLAFQQMFLKVIPTLLLGLLFFAFYFVVYAFALGATTIAVARIYGNQPIDVAGSYRDVRPHGGRLVLLMLWSGARIGLVCLGLMVIVGLIVGMVGRLSPILSVMILVSGVMVSLAVMVFFTVRYAVCVPAAVLEGLGPNRAIARSVQLTRGYLGRIFLILLCAIVIAYATALLLQGPFMIVALFAGPGTVTALVFNVVAVVLGTAGSMFSGPIMIIGLAMAYYDLRIRKEALDLQMMFDSLDAPRA